MPLTLLPTPADDRVVDLGLRRAAAQAAVRAAADAPVRHLPAALLDALQGSWGTPQELLGARTAPVRLAAARSVPAAGRQEVVIFARLHAPKIAAC